MEWTYGTRFGNGQLEAQVVNNDGEARCIAIESLASVKMPYNSAWRQSTDVPSSLDTWAISTNLKDYAEALGLPYNAALPNQHQLFEFSYLNTRYVVPALVLIQAIFKPNGYLIPLLFRPDQFGSICYAKTTNDGVVMELIPPWAKHLKVNKQLMVERLSWVTFYPSARQMIHSIFQYALSGWVTMKLPHAKLRMNCFGVRKDNTFYVSTLGIRELTPTEDAEVRLANPNPESGANLKTEVDVSFLSPCDLRLSDEEWREIEGNLLRKTIMKPHTLNQKHIFEDILYRLLTNTPWRKINYQSGTYLNATYAYGSWRKDGRLAAALNTLRKLRDDSIRY